MADTKQLDLFEDSRNVLLNNAVLKAFAAYDTDAATLAVAALHKEFPQHHDLPSHHQLIEQLSNFRRELQPNGLATRHQQLTQTLLPLARQLFGSAQAKVWARPLWAGLAQTAAALDYDNAHPEIHAAALWLAADAPGNARSAIEKIPSWRRIPAPLAWMSEIEIRHGAPETWWPLLAELAWLEPERLESLLVTTPVAVNRQKARFLAEFENNGEHHDLAWFPAWLLIHHSELRDLLRPAQSAQSEPAQAFHLLLDLLHLEKTGQQATQISQRAKLRALAPDLFADFMRSR
jgi:hypothetical protein